MFAGKHVGIYWLKIYPVTETGTVREGDNNANNFNFTDLERHTPIQFMHFPTPESQSSELPPLSSTPTPPPSFDILAELDVTEAFNFSALELISIPSCRSSVDIEYQAL